MSKIAGTATITLLIVFLMPFSAMAQNYIDARGNVRVAVVMNSYNGDRAGAEMSQGPNALESGGLKDLLSDIGCEIMDISDVRLTSDEEREYGRWNRMGIANGHLCEMTADNEKSGYFNIGLLGNCNSLMGMLAGLQHSGRGRRPLKVGLVWIDAHGDFNTPETTLSGMLGGMPVAVSAGMCLERLRLRSDLDPALPTKYIVMAGIRDTDPLEQELIDRSDIEMITTQDIRDLSDNIHHQMERLSRLTDIIYIHIDMDVLDPAEVQGHSLNVPDGPTSLELADALTIMFEYEKASGLGIASYPAARDEDKLSLKAAYNLIEGAIKGIKARK
ncbi:arginase family protein [candidate division KSB1 bacterium]